MFIPEHVGLDFRFGTITCKGRWTGKLTDRRGGDDAQRGWRCSPNVFPLDVFILSFRFMFYLDVFVEVCKTAAERARKGRRVLLEQWAYTFIVESV